MEQNLTTTRAAYLPVPSSFEEGYRIAKVLAASDLVPRDYKGKPENCLVAMQWGADIGLPGLQALQNIAVINGRPSIWGDAAKALALAHPACEDIEEYIEGEGDKMVAVCVATRKGKKPVTQRFSVEDAKKAGLWGKQGPWQAYPKRMLQMRARGFALRDAFPDALRGLVLAEEAQDYDVRSENADAPKVIQMPRAKVTTEYKAEEAAPAEVVEAEVVQSEPQKVEPQKDEPQGEKQEAKKAPEKSQTGTERAASKGMLTFMRKKAADKGITDEQICLQHGIEAIDGITEAKANEIVAWIKGL